MKKIIFVSLFVIGCSVPQAVSQPMVQAPVATPTTQPHERFFVKNGERVVASCDFEKVNAQVQIKSCRIEEGSTLEELISTLGNAINQAKVTPTPTPAKKGK